MHTLDRAQVDAMWGVFSRHYEGVTRELFERDLFDKSHVILLRDADTGEIRGLSTVKTYRTRVQGRPVAVVFSGDTIVDAQYWGSRALHRAFFAFIMRVLLRSPRTPVYWFLITKGYKTYLLLARNFPEHWPRWDLPTPPWQAAVIDTLARRQFSDAWRPELGVLRFEQDQPLGASRLRPDVAPVGEEELRQPDIRFFHERNPRAAEGDELCCIGRVDLKLAARFGKKQLVRLVGRAGIGSGGIGYGGAG